VKETQAQYARLLNAIHEVYYRTDTDGKIIEISPSIDVVAGYQSDAITGMPATFFYKHPKDRKHFITTLESQGFITDYELELLHKDGRTIHASINAHMIFDDAQNIIGVEGLLRDISERVGLEQQLNRLNQELESRVKQRTNELEQQNLQLQVLSQAIEQSAEGFIITDCAGRVNYINKAFETINGYNSQETLGNTLSMLSSGKHDADFFHEIWQTIRAGQVWEGSIQNRRKNGEIYPALMTIVPITIHGEIAYYSAIQQDMSEHVAMEGQFRQAQKMEAIGTLVSGLAHDFNNMLAGLLMHLFLAKRNINNTEKVLDALGKAEKLGTQSAKIIKDLMLFSRNDPSEMQALPFNSILRDSIALLKISIPNEIQLSVNICTQKMSILGDATQLQQVLMNILNNASDALHASTHGHIQIHLEHFIIDQPFADQHPDIHEDAMLHLCISDNGCGISDKNIDKVFDPFFTTKHSGQGTGLGLSMVYGCINNHRGILEVESKHSIGTSFHIYLPLIKDHFAIEKTNTNTHTKQGNGELILVADDNDTIRKLLVESLHMLNYKTIQASDGKQALHAFSEHQQDLKLAILDMVMPCISGQEAARRMRITAPSLPIIFSTGHDTHYAMQEINDFDACLLYQKPFKISKLLQDINTLLHDNNNRD